MSEEQNVTSTEETTVDNSGQLQQLQSSNDSLVSKNQELLNELKQLKATVNDMGGLDSLKQIVATNTQQKQEQLEKENSLDALKAHYDEQIGLANKKNDELTNSIVQNTIDAQLKSAVTKAKGSYTLLEHQLKTQVQGVYDNGQVKLSVNDKNGMPLMVDGKEATLTDLVNAYKTNEEFARAFDVSQGITGSGAPAGSQITSSKAPETLSEITELYKKNPGKALEIMKAKGLA